MVELSEKYRPKDLSDLVGQNEIIEAIKSKDYLKNYLFLGPAGSGKTTLAYILADRYKVPLIEYNASDDRKINFVRDEIKRQVRLCGEKILLLDEAEQLTPEAQAALRRIMEDPKTEAHFILTGNDGWKIIDPIKSRCTDFQFSKLKDEDILRRIIYICKQEKIKIDEDSQEGLVELLHQANGDMRKAINILEKVSSRGNITKKAVLSFCKPKVSTEALSFALDGDFEKAKQLVEDAFVETTPRTLIEDFYESIGKIEKKEWKILLYRELAKTERSINTESNPITPLVQFVGFIAYAWILPHFPDSFRELSE